MNKAVEAIFKELADVCIQTIDRPWLELEIEADAREEGVLTLSGRYKSAVSQTMVSFPILPKAVDMVQEFRERLRADGAQLWTTVVFTLKKNGQFDMQLKYE